MDPNKVITKFDVAACAVGKARGAAFMPCHTHKMQIAETAKLLKEAAAAIDAASMELRAWRIAESLQTKS